MMPKILSQGSMTNNVRFPFSSGDTIWGVYNYTEYPNQCMLLLGVMHDVKCFTEFNFFTNKSSIGCLDIIEHK